MKFPRSGVLATALLFVAVAVAMAQRGGSLARTSMNNVGVNFVVHGSVVLPDNVAAHRIIRLEQVCGGHAAGQVFADSKGHYSFDFGIVNNQSGAAATAPVNPLGKAASTFADCVIRAQLEGFRGNAVSIGDLVKTQKTDAAPIVLQPLGKEINAVMSATDAAVPGAEKKEYDKGLDLVAAGKWKDAIKAMEKAASGAPGFSTAWLSAGILHLQQKDPEGARKDFEKAIAADGKFAPPLVELALVETTKPEWTQVADHTSQAIALDADASPRAYYLNAMANMRLRKMDAALKSSSAGVRIDRDHLFPDLQFYNGILLLSTGDRTRGRAQLETYLELAPDGDNAEDARKVLKSATGAK